MEIFAPIQHQLKKPHHNHRGLKHICRKMLSLSPISAQNSSYMAFPVINSQVYVCAWLRNFTYTLIFAQRPSSKGNKYLQSYKSSSTNNREFSRDH